MNTLVCKECKNPIPQSSVDTDLNFVLCPTCDCGFDFFSLSQNQMASSLDGINLSYLDLPDNLSFDTQTSRLTIKEEKSKAGSILYFVFLIVAGILLGLYFFSKSEPPLPEGSELDSMYFFLPMAIFYSVTLLVMLAIGIHRNFSHNELSFENRGLLLRTPPFGVPFDKFIPIGDMDTIYAKAHDMGVRVGRETTWEIRVINNDGKSHRLIYQVDNRKQALHFIRYYSLKCGLLT